MTKLKPAFFLDIACRLRFIFLCVAVLCTALIFPKGVCAGTYSIEFDRPLYHIARGADVKGAVLLHPAPPSGLFSYGFRLFVFDPANSVWAPSVEIAPALTFDAVRGPGPSQSNGAGLYAVKGTVDFASEPLAPFSGETLAAF